MSDERQLTITVLAEPDASVLALAGELDLAVADHVRAALDATDGTRIIVDLSMLTFLDSSGLAVFIRAKRDGKDIRLRAPSAQVAHAISVAGLTGLIDTEPEPRTTRHKMQVGPGGIEPPTKGL